MSEATGDRTDRVGRAFMAAFVGFFAAPAIVVPTLMVFLPGRIDYANTGFALLISVGVGAFVGWIVGTAIDARVLQGLARAARWP